MLLAGIILTALGLTSIVFPFAYGITIGFNHPQSVVFRYIRIRATVLGLGLALIIVHFALSV